MARTWTDRELGRAIRWAIEEERRRVELRIQDLYVWKGIVTREIRSRLENGERPPKLRSAEENGA